MQPKDLRNPVDPELKHVTAKAFLQSEKKRLGIEPDKGK